MPQQLAPYDGPALAEARALVARLREPCSAGFSGQVLLHPQASHRVMREDLKRFALFHPMNTVQVCDWARRGFDEADSALRELIVEFTARGERLPPALVTYTHESLHPRLRRRRMTGPKRAGRWLQDISILVMIMLITERFGLKPTRRQSTKPSACSVVAAALKEAGIHRGGERALEKIWQRLAPAAF